MSKDINKEPYDKATLAKLDIFEQYLVAWLPVFIKTPSVKNIMICDYFAGSGQDSEGNYGSPLRILRVIKSFEEMLLREPLRIDIVLNDSQKDKFLELQDSIKAYVEINGSVSNIFIEYHNKDFQDLFREHYDHLKQQPNLLFIDQYGLKEVNDEIFQMLVNLRMTDFLFFASSSFMKRFVETQEFQTHFPDINVQKISDANYSDSHRMMVDYYKRKLPVNNDTKLYPYSLKKGHNIYGLVFGSKHPLGVEKFLELAWNNNKVNGEANFDIDDDIQVVPHLFDHLPGYERKKSKIEVYEAELKSFIMSRGEVTNREVWEFTLNMGHPKSHAKDCIDKLRKLNLIECDARLGFSYETCVKKGNIKVIKAKA